MNSAWPDGSSGMTRTAPVSSQSVHLHQSRALENRSHGGIVGIGVMVIMQIVQPNGGPACFRCCGELVAHSSPCWSAFSSHIFHNRGMLACRLHRCETLCRFGGGCRKDGHYWPPVSLQTHWSNLGLDNFTRWLILTAFLLIFGIGGAVIVNKDRRANSRESGPVAPTCRWPVWGWGVWGPIFTSIIGWWHADPRNPGNSRIGPSSPRKSRERW